MRWRADKEYGGKVATINGVPCRIRQRVRGLFFAYIDGDLFGEFRSLREAEEALIKALGEEI